MPLRMFMSGLLPPLSDPRRCVARVRAVRHAVHFAWPRSPRLIRNRMNTATDTSPEALRARMVDRILSRQRLAPAVEDALRRVERHRYVPDAPLTDAYEEKAVITHTFPDGTHLSCASGPTIVA